LKIKPSKNNQTFSGHIPANASCFIVTVHLIQGYSVVQHSLIALYLALHSLLVMAPTTPLPAILWVLGY
jgi:hypothetical protein